MVQKYGVVFLTLLLLIYVEIYGSVLSTVFDIDLASPEYFLGYSFCGGYRQAYEYYILALH